MGPTHRKMTVFGIAVVSVAMVTAAMVPAASAGVQASPVFQPASFSSGITQYGDAIQRAEFWGPVSTNGGGYHVLLGQPTVLPTQTITVPTGHPITGSIKGVTYGLIDDDWFNNIVLNVPAQLHAGPGLQVMVRPRRALRGDQRAIHLPQHVHTAFDALLRTAARTTRGPASPKRSRP